MIWMEGEILKTQNQLKWPNNIRISKNYNSNKKIIVTEKEREAKEIIIQIFAQEKFNDRT